MKKLLFLIIFSFLILAGSAHLLTANDEQNGLNAPSAIELMRMNLYISNADGSSIWVDGAVTQYGADYSDEIDGNDGRKMTNPGVNVCILRDNINLVVERRQLIVDTDTTFFKMWGLQKRTYEMRLVGQNLDHPGLKAWLEDDYLHTSTPVLLNDTTHIKIDINNDPGSYAPERFRLIYETAPVIHYTSINGYPGKGAIMLSWVGENDTDGNQYFVEKSKDGISFFTAGSLKLPDSGGKYEWTDHFPATEYNYYRVKVIAPDNETSYSNIVHEKRGIKTDGRITVFPNPATNENINLHMFNQPAGIYKLNLFNSSGKLILQETINKEAGMNQVRLQINQIPAPGIYHLEIIKPDTERETLNVVF